MFEYCSVHCHVFAIIKEPRLGRSATVCGGGDSARQRHAYTSDGHAVEIRFMTARKAGQYLLKYEGRSRTTYVLIHADRQTHRETMLRQDICSSITSGTSTGDANEAWRQISLS